MRLHELPDDVLISACSLCDIDALLSLRLTCNSIRVVIDTYIKTIAPAVARTTFPSCEQLLTVPKSGYSLKWLRSLIPSQLASIALDKDKLRRYPYINSGFPYGIPSESGCEDASHWRARIANGWTILRCFHLVSRDVYSKSLEELERPKRMRRVSSGMRTSKIWQAVSCPYAGCTDHGMKHLFESRPRRSFSSSYISGETERRRSDSIEEVRRRETIVLKKRLEWLEVLSDSDLLDYVYLWHILLWTFRPYRKPGASVLDSVRNWPSSTDVPRTNWQASIRDIALGCSWLNWFILHVGTTPFWKQWWSTPSAPDYVRNQIWSAYNERSHHQIELEREFICKFEFALRKRCLNTERVKRLESEVLKGRAVKTISLDCIPWVYDQHPIVNKPQRDFPWYEPGQWVWMDGDLWLQTKPGVTWANGQLKMSTALSKRRPNVEYDEAHEYSSNQGGAGDEDLDDNDGRGPLAHVSYLVYLGVEDGDRVWGCTDADATELTF